MGRPQPHTSGIKQATGEAVYLDDMPQFTSKLYFQITIWHIIWIYLSRDERKPIFGTRFNTNRSVQSLEKVATLKFWVEIEEELYNLGSENKGDDQLHSYCEADLRLCSRQGKNLGSS